MSTVTYRVEGMDCADCARHIQEGVTRLEGLKNVEVNFATGLLTFEGCAPEEAIRKRVESLGYRLGDSLDEIQPVAAQPRAGFLAYLFSRFETRLALAGGVLLLVSWLSNLLGLPEWVATLLQLAALVLAGYPVARSGLANLFINRGVSINLLMTIAAVGAVIIGERSEAASLIFLFAVAEALEGYTTDRARRVLGELHQLAPAQALRLDDKGEALVPVAALQVGERILVRPGERIPLDGQVLSGTSEADQAAITGESMPAPKGPGDAVFAGSVNGSGALELRVTRPAGDTALARIIRMVTEAQGRRAESQRFIDRFAALYTPAVVAIAALVAILPPLLFNQPFFNTPAEHGWLYRALALLVIACPCALVISAPVTVISAISAAAKGGVLIKGGAHLEKLAQVRALAFDKTGTLTRGKPVLTQLRAVDCSGEDECARCDEVLALAGALERRSAHPLAEAVVRAAGERGVLERYAPAEEVVQINGRGLQGKVDGKLATVGSHTLFDDFHPHSDEVCGWIEQAEDAGHTTMLVCDGERVRGYLALADEIRPESAAVLAELRGLGLREAMLTGDNPAAAARVGAELGIAEVKAGLLPENKVSAVEGLRHEYGLLAMVGDGINDAPALSAANLGIAVGGAINTQAMETADVVLMNGDLSRLPFAIRLARLAQQIIRQNVAFSLLTKLVFILLALGGVATMWMAVLGDMGVSLLVTFNGLRPLKMKK
jgi:Zn2+/Cd2+-exporting ATPase